jgi:hypothetical protein
MLWLINQATAGEISGQPVPPRPEPSGTEKSGGPDRTGGGTSFDDFKIDANA